MQPLWSSRLEPSALRGCPHEEWDFPWFSSEVSLGLESPIQIWTMLQGLLSVSLLGFLGRRNRVGNHLKKINIKN